MLGRVTCQKVCQPEAPSVSAASSSARPCAVISGISCARDEREGDEERREHEAGQREDDLDVVRLEPGPNQPCAPNSSTKTRPETTGETEKGRSISVISSRLAAEIELGDRPGRGDPEDGVQRHRDRRDEQGQLDRGAARRAP